MKLLEVSHFVGQGFRKEPIVVLCGSDVLREDGLFLESSVYIIGIQPIVLTFVLHDFEYATAIDFAHVLVMELLLQS